ncbi:MAG: hypothetical protein QXP42_03350 [Candidatus Micrarchaeia archaeon]
MRANVVLIIVMFLVVVALVVFFTTSFKKHVLTKEEAERYVIEDLRAKFPNADKYGVISIENESGSWKVEASVVHEAGSRCPKRTHVFYDYPRSGFALREENITKGCRICVAEPLCIIVYPEEAIIASHTLPGSDRTVEFLGLHTDAVADAEFRSVYEHGGRKYSNVWVVRWYSRSANMTHYVVIAKTNATIYEEFSVEGA